jgi:hypothetical protein
MRLLKGVGKFKASLKANMRQRFSSNPALYHLQTIRILTSISFFLTWQLFHIKNNLIPQYLNSAMFYYKKSALVYTSSKCSSHKNFRSSAKCPQLHRREYAKPSTAVIMCQQPSMNLFITNQQTVYVRNQQCNTHVTPPTVRTTTPTATNYFLFTRKALHGHTNQSSARQWDTWQFYSQVGRVA